MSEQNEPNREVLCKGCGKPLGSAQVKTMLGNPEYNQWCREGFCSFTCFERSTHADERDDVGAVVPRPDGFAEDASQANSRSPRAIAPAPLTAEAASLYEVEDRKAERLTRRGAWGEAAKVEYAQFRFLDDPKRKLALLGGPAFLGLLFDLVRPPWAFSIITGVTLGLMAKRTGRSPWAYGIPAAVVFLVVAAAADMATGLLVLRVQEALPLDVAYSIPDVAIMGVPIAVTNLLLFGAFVGLWPVVLKHMGPPRPNSFAMSRPAGVTIVCYIFLVFSLISLPPVAWALLSPHEAYNFGVTQRLFALAQFLILGVTGVFMLKGANWARWLYVISSAIGILVNIFTMGFTLLLLPVTVFYAAILSVLFADASTIFFTQRNPSPSELRESG